MIRLMNKVNLSSKTVPFQKLRLVCCNYHLVMPPKNKEVFSFARHSSHMSNTEEEQMQYFNSNQGNVRSISYQFVMCAYNLKVLGLYNNTQKRRRFTGNCAYSWRSHYQVHPLQRKIIFFLYYFAEDNAKWNCFLNENKLIFVKSPIYSWQFLKMKFSEARATTRLMHV